MANLLDHIKPNPWFKILPSYQQAKLIYAYKQKLESLCEPSLTDRAIVMVELGLALPRDQPVPVVSPFPR